MKDNLIKIYKRNTFFIILLGITGFCFGILDWDSNLADLVYLKYNNKLLISIISANIGTVRILATLYCIKINDSRRPNYIFKTCMLLCSIVALITAIVFDLNLIIPFVIIYLLEVMLLEIFSGYHYAYAYNSLPEQEAMNAHSKRISVFKLLQAVGIAVASFICAKYINHPFMILSVLATIVFLICIVLTNQVKNFPKTENQPKQNTLKKLNIFKYSQYFRNWLGVRIIGQFALSSLVVLLSLKIIDGNLSLVTLKISKSLIWVLSGIGFFFSDHFIKKKIIVKGDVVLKFLIAILLPFTFLLPEIMFFIIVLTGVLNPFNTMSHLEMLRKDKDNINLAQKDMVINLIGYISKMLSAYILLNINSNIAIGIMAVVLLISTILEYKLDKKKVN